MKNITFALGLSWLIICGLTYQIVDWDIGVSLVMVGFTYFTAEWVLMAIWRRQYRQWLKAAFLTWFAVSGSYTCYWLLMGHPERMVQGQWAASLCLSLLCGAIWSALPKLPEAIVLVRSKIPGAK